MALGVATANSSVTGPGFARWSRVCAEPFRPLGMAVERVELDDIRMAAGVHDLARRLDLGPLSKAGARTLDAVVGQRTNQKTNAKGPRELSDAELTRWEQEVEAAVTGDFAPNTTDDSRLAVTGASW